MDAALVERSQAGDETAFASLVADLGPRLHAVAFRILRDVTASEDAVQQTLLDAWQDLPRLQQPTRFEAWVYRILVRICYAHAKRRRRRLIEVELPSSGIPTPGNDYANVEIRDQLERAFERLTVEQRTVVVLHHYLGLTVRQVADTTQAPVETVRSRLRRAMSLLQVSMAADGRTARPTPDTGRRVPA